MLPYSKTRLASFKCFNPMPQDPQSTGFNGLMKMVSSDWSGYRMTTSHRSCVVSSPGELMSPLSQRSPAAYIPIRRLGQQLSVNHLKPMLVLATDWGFKELGEFALKAMPKHAIPPLEMIILARRANVQDWLPEPLTSPSTRLEPLKRMKCRRWDGRRRSP